MQFENKFDAMMHVINTGKHSDLDIERITGISRTQVYRWRSGETKNIQAKTFTMVMDALKVSYDINANGIMLNEDNNQMKSIETQVLENLLTQISDIKKDRDMYKELTLVNEDRITALENKLEKAQNHINVNDPEWRKTQQIN